MRNNKSIISLLIITILCSSNIVISATFNSDFSDNKNLINFSEKPSLIDNIVKNSSVKIEYPLSTLPVIVEKGGEFTVRFTCDPFDSVYAYISTSYEPIVDEFWLTIGEIWYSNDLWNMNVTIPYIVTEELYNITILLDQNDILLSSSQQRAVSVVEEFTDNFSFIHLADFHVGDPRGLLESIRESIGMKSIKRCISEINILNPNFVIISGDLVFGQLYPREYSKEYKKCYELIQMFDVPTYLCPGNHDGYRRPFEDGLEFWKKFFGPHYYSFDYGNYHYLSINSYDMSALSRFAFLFIPLNWGGSIQDEQLNWIEEDLASSNPDLTFMFMHHNPLWETKRESLFRKSYKNRENLLDLIYQYGVDMVLAGHVHFDNVTIVNETTYVTTTTPSSSYSGNDSYWGYRLIKIEDGEIASFNYKEPKFSIPSYNLELTYLSRDSAEIVNDLETDIDALVKFKLPKDEYKVDNGEIVLTRENEEFVEIYVEVLVEKLSTLTINVTLKTATEQN
ncbi:MAG: metallophosphoesterase [Thermoplasmatales archaeon]|nr:MAG: metallophosphoesterase [Thermoplasmatales archaeon]